MKEAIALYKRLQNSSFSKEDILNMKSIDLWNYLVDRGCCPDSNNVIKAPRGIFIPQKIINGTVQNCEVVDLVMNECGQVTINCCPRLTYSRFNQGVVTVNLPYVALEAKEHWLNNPDLATHEDLVDIFFKELDERLELCHRALKCRHERLEGTLSDISPIHWQNGALARLGKGEKIDKLLHHGYSTISLGYAGLYECVKALTGKSHTDEEAKPLALTIMKRMNDKCNEWKLGWDETKLQIYTGSDEFEVEGLDE